MSTKTQMYSEPTVALIMRATAESLQVHPRGESVDI